MKFRKKLGAAIVASTMVVGAGVVGTMAPAAAATNSIILAYTNSGASVTRDAYLYSSRLGWASNGTVFQMRCWTDNGPWIFAPGAGGVGSARYFYGYSYGARQWGWVLASYVGMQAKVGHC